MRHRQQAETSTTHLYHAGQRVRFSRGFPYRNAVDDDYEVLGQLPSRDGECQYRIKSSSEPYERIVKEGEIDRT
jgi:hypothetical protein